MIIQRRPGIIEENGEKRYIEFSTKTRYNEQHQQEQYIEILYLDEDPATTKEMEGKITLQGKEFVLPDSTIIKNIEGTSTNYPSKNHIQVTKDEEKYYGSTLLTLGEHLVRVICGGKTIIAGLYDAVNEKNVVKHNLAVNARKKHSIEEAGEYHIKLKKPDYTIIAKYHKEWCGCSNNKLETNLNSINIIRN